MGTPSQQRVNRMATRVWHTANRGSKRETQAFGMIRRRGWVGRLLAATLSVALILPGPAQAGAQMQANQRAADARAARFFESFTDSSSDPARASVGYAQPTPALPHGASNPSEVLPVPLLPQRVEWISGPGADADPWALFDGKSATALKFASSEP